MKDIVIDTQVIRLYDTPSDPSYRELFTWLAKGKGVLTVSKKILVEYYGTMNPLVGVLINQLTAEGRLIKVDSEVLKNFKDDKHYKYTCNTEDIFHARLVFVSHRKKLVTHDQPLCNDVNGFKKVNKVKPAAVKHPTPSFYS